MRNALLILTSATALVAEPAATLSVPVIGYVYDSASKSVRPIAGVPGAAALESPLASATKLENGFVSQNRRYLVATTLDGATAVDLSTGIATEMSGVPADIAFGSWSSDGTAIALSSRSGVIQVWTGFPGSPSLRFEIQAGAVAGIAASDGGRSVLFWNDSGFSVSDGTTTRQLVPEPVTAAAFRPGTEDWAVITKSQLLRSYADPLPLPIEHASAVAFTTRSLLVTGERSVAAVDDNGSRILECGCSSTILERLTGADVFRLTGPDESTLAIYDGDAPEPRIVYIPTEGGRQ